MNNKSLAVVIPVYNEHENITECLGKLKEILNKSMRQYEIICVDDGSKDGTTEILLKLAKQDSRVKVVIFRRNFGQTAAMSAGFDFASGDIIITMDADLQNRPEDIPRLIELVEKGYDVVCGWRKHRKDGLFLRRIPSYIANKIVSFVTGVKLHDHGCTLRAYRTELVKKIKLYGEMHRFLPALLVWQGADLIEIEVGHAPRIRGKSKYGIFRTFKVMLDLITVKLLTSYSTKPIYMFGGAGSILLFFSFIVFLVVAYRVLVMRSLSATPLIFIMVILVISGIQMILTGLLAEINIRTFFDIKDKPIYNVKDKINF